MKKTRLGFALAWVVGPVALAAVAGELGTLRARQSRGEFFTRTSALSELERKRLETLPLRAMDNVTWTLGGAELARKLLNLELDELDELDGRRRARVLVRLGMIDTNFEGQAAIFSSACAADPSVCDTAALKTAAEQEAKLRFVAPGNQLPLPLIGGHPPIRGDF